jgi:hypothetical protein
MSFTLQPVNAQVLEKMLTGLKQEAGTQITSATEMPGPPATLNYQITGHGITAKVVHYIEAQTTVVTILDKPWWIPESMIELQVRDALAIARG